jgi:adenylosuccinate lyase
MEEPTNDYKTEIENDVLNKHYLLNLSPIDGRYHTLTKNINEYFSEYGFMKYRLEVEIKYILFISDFLPEIYKHEMSPQSKDEIYNIFNNFSIDDCKRIKEIEKVCNHDVKSVEYFIREKLNKLGLSYLNPFIHFGLTSQDINNTSITRSIKQYINNNYLPFIREIVKVLNTHSQNWKTICMLSRTHGQPAVPTTIGKEFRVFVYRLSKQIDILTEVEYYGKFGGAVGNLNAHYLAYPDIEWDDKLTNFLESELDLTREEFTTQIDNYENLSVVFDCVRRINTILIDLNRDIWQYISLDYLKQRVLQNEVGSSTMPQKVNPINFENSEGNLGIANTLLDFLSNKLPVSRMQRDLTDSTILRNLGTIFGHVSIAYSNLIKGLNKIYPNKEKLDEDLNNNVAILTEGIQVLLRKEGIENAYEKLKNISRGNLLTKEDLNNFADQLTNVSLETREKIKALTPLNYLGNSANFK